MIDYDFCNHSLSFNHLNHSSGHFVIEIRDITNLSFFTKKSNQKSDLASAKPDILKKTYSLLKASTGSKRLAFSAG